MHRLAAYLHCSLLVTKHHATSHPPSRLVQDQTFRVMVMPQLWLLFCDFRCRVYNLIKCVLRVDQWLVMPGLVFPYLGDQCGRLLMTGETGARERHTVQVPVSRYLDIQICRLMLLSTHQCDTITSPVEYQLIVVIKFSLIHITLHCSRFQRQLRKTFLNAVNLMLMFIVYYFIFVVKYINCHQSTS